MTAPPLLSGPLRAAVVLRHAHPGYLSQFPGPQAYPRRILGHLRRLRDVRHLDRALFRLVFDLAKLGGELSSRP